MPFSSVLSDWLQTHADFVNADFAEDMQGGRSLGPASGTLWDAYPFLAPCQYSGLFAGMSLSGIAADQSEVFVLEYSSEQGFAPAEDGPFSGGQWQQISGDQWQDISPLIYTPCKVVPPVHPADLVLSIGGKVVNTRDWAYSGMPISNKYYQHSWVSRDMGDVYCLVVVTYIDRPETVEPFLRPQYVTGKSTLIDPHCLFADASSTYLFDGRVLILPGAQIDIGVRADDAGRGDVVTISRSFDEHEHFAVQTISGLPADKSGNFACVSGGCHRFSVPYEEYDPDLNEVHLAEGKIALQNACPTCCHCEDYIAAYERLRELCEVYSGLVGQFSDLYTRSTKTRNALEKLLHAKARLLRAYFSEWGEDEHGFYCAISLVVSATEALKPAATAGIRFTSGGVPIKVKSVQMLMKSSALSILAGLSDDEGTMLLLGGIKTAYIGAKTVKLIVRFHEEFNAETFDPSRLGIECNGEV